MGLGIVMMKSLKTLRMPMLRRRGCSWPCLSVCVGFCNKYTFQKVSQLGFRKSSLVRFCEFKMHVFSQTFAVMLSQKYSDFGEICKIISQVFAIMISHCGRLSQAFTHFRKYGLAAFCNISRALQFIVSQSFANRFSQGFANAKIMVFRKVFKLQWAVCWCRCDLSHFIMRSPLQFVVLQHWQTSPSLRDNLHPGALRSILSESSTATTASTFQFRPSRSHTWVWNSTTSFKF